MPGPGERPQHLGRRLRDAAAPPPNAARICLGQLGQPRRHARPGRRLLAKQLAQHGVVHVGPPRQPVVAHLGGDQRAGATPTATSSRNRPGCSVRAIRASWSAYPSTARRLASGSKPAGGGRSSKSASCPASAVASRATSGGTGRPWRRAHSAASAARLAPPAVVAEQQRLGQLEVVAAVHPYARAQQPRVDRRGRRPDPAGIVRRSRAGHGSGAGRRRSAWARSGCRRRRGRAATRRRPRPMRPLPARPHSAPSPCTTGASHALIRAPATAAGVDRGRALP